MEKKVAHVLKGFLELDREQRAQFVEEVNKIINGTLTPELLKESIRKSMSTTVNFGPPPTGCPCCGR